MVAEQGLLSRPATQEDVPAIIELAQRSLGWAGDERDRAFFEWKHFQNPFGLSPGWATFDDERLVAFRTLLRWELRDERGHRLRLVRAVDTATDPEYQGRGLFRRLTMDAVEALRAEGIDGIFNTPNDQSRPGYLKMGWSVLGRPALAVRPASLTAASRLLGARVPADKWSLPLSIGAPVADVLDQLGDRAARRQHGWATDRSPAFLAWRYGFAPLNYRALEVAGGYAIVRVRRRGPLVEVALVEWLSDEVDPAAVGKVVRQVGDYGVAIGLGTRHGLLPVPRQGPIVTWRPLANPDPPKLRELRFSLGDLELF